MPLPDTLATVNAMVEPTNEVSMLDAMFTPVRQRDPQQALLAAVEQVGNLEIGIRLQGFRGAPAGREHDRS